jgi:hypothetical protein
MPWLYSSEIGSFATFFGVNTGNQHATNLTLPANSAITQLRVKANGRNTAVNTRLCMWENNGSLIRQSSTFSMAGGSESTTPTTWRTQNITNYKVTSSKTVWIGLYRNPNGGHVVAMFNTGTSYYKTNKATFPSVISMSGASSHTNRRMNVGVFYIEKPATPTSLTVTRNSDTKYTLNWSRVSTSDNPIKNIQVQRWNNVSNSWSTVATLGNVATYTDTGTITNRSYRWRIRATNDAGNSNYTSQTSLYKTTPAKLTNVKATRIGAFVVVSWTNPATTADNIEIQRINTAGGSWTNLSTGIGGSGTLYNDTSPLAQAKYRVRTRAGTLYSVYTESNEVITLQAPSKPSNLNPRNFNIIDVDAVNRFTWQHNSLDTSSQTRFILNYKEDGGSWQEIDIPTQNDYFDFGENFFTTGLTYIWRVRTYGAFTSPSTWSDEQTFYASSKPSAIIISPEDEDLYISATLNVEYEYTDVNNLSMNQVNLKLFNENDVLIDEKNLFKVVESGNTDTIEIDRRLENGQTYWIQITCKNSNNLWSIPNTCYFDVEFLPTTKPEIIITDNEDGTTTIEIYNPPVENELEESETSFNRLFRKVNDEEFILVYDNLERDSIITDYLPLLNDITTYYVESISEDGANNKSDDEEIRLQNEGVFILNSGDNFTDKIILFGNIEFSENFDNENNSIHFSGREYPVNFEGKGKLRNISLKAFIESSDYQEFFKFLNENREFFYRDWRNRHFKCKVANKNVSKFETDFNINLNIERVDMID